MDMDHLMVNYHRAPLAYRKLMKAHCHRLWRDPVSHQVIAYCFRTRQSFERAWVAAEKRKLLGCLL